MVGLGIMISRDQLCHGLVSCLVLVFDVNWVCFGTSQAALSLWYDVSFVYTKTFLLSMVQRFVCLSSFLCPQHFLCITFRQVTSIVLLLLFKSGMGVAQMAKCWYNLFFLYCLVVPLLLVTIQHWRLRGCAVQNDNVNSQSTYYRSSYNAAVGKQYKSMLVINISVCHNVQTSKQTRNQNSQVKQWYRKNSVTTKEIRDKQK